jgi:hypothetical protein
LDNPPAAISVLVLVQSGFVLYRHSYQQGSQGVG